VGVQPIPTIDDKQVEGDEALFMNARVDYYKAGCPEGRRPQPQLRPRVLDALEGHRHDQGQRHPVLEAVHQERRRAERQPRRQGPCREKRDGRPRDPHGRRAGQLETGDDVGWAD
jgi:hypothetical protein